MGEGPRTDKRTLKIRRTTPQAIGTQITAEQLSAAVEAAVAGATHDMRRQLDRVMLDMQALSHVLIDMRGILQLSSMDEDHASTKARLSELVEGLVLATEHLREGPYAATRVDSLRMAVNMRPDTSVLGSHLGRNRPSYDPEGDDIVENASEEMDGPFSDLDI